MAPKRDELLTAIVARKRFELRLVSAGLRVEPIYDFNSHALATGTLVAVLHGQGIYAQLEIGQVVSEHMWTGADNKINSRYTVVLVKRLWEAGAHVSTNISIQSKQVLCVFRPTAEK